MSSWLSTFGWIGLACLSALPVAAQDAPSLQSSREGAGWARPDRVAIVIGNQDYVAVEDLGNARRDAQDVAEMLRRFRFSVFEGYDLDKRGFEDLLRRALLNIPDGADVLFYYAGHGIQIGDRNYLLPTDSAFTNIYDVPLETMTLDRVIDSLAARGKAHVAILDSCRDNPFPNVRLATDLDATLVGTKTGFEVFAVPEDTLVAFSTSPGEVALDGDEGGNSPYTQAVMQAAQGTPGESIAKLFPQVRELVQTATDGRQVPSETSTLEQPFYLLPEGTGELQADASGVLSVGTRERGMAIAAPAEGGVELEPMKLTIEKAYDRRVQIGDLLMSEFDFPYESAEIAVPPKSGILSFGAGAGTGRNRITYSPEILDVRATDLESYSLKDSFSIHMSFADGLWRRVEVELDLEVGACDLAMGAALDLGGVGVYRLANEIDIREGLAACERAVQLEPENGRFLYQLGRAQQSAAMVSEAYESFEAAASAGHVRALYALSVLLDSEQIDHEAMGIPYDPELALELLGRGIAAGDPFPMHRLGKRMLREGESPEERQRGFEFLERAVELGHTFSMNELGIYFLRKDTDHYLPERGMGYLRASDARRDIYGTYNLGFVSASGLDGNEPDFAEAHRYFLAATEGGHPTGPSAIARMILRGQHGERDVPTAVRWYDMSLARGDGWGGANAATLILQGQVPGKGEADAAVRAAKALTLSNAKAAEAADTYLGEVSRRGQGAALQMLLQELGEEDITVDGAVGPQTLAALERASDAAGVAFAPGESARDRLLFAARLYWIQNPVRFDLF